jgi:carboxyl-terminal processing protease
LDFSLQREIIRSRSASASILVGKYFYVKVRQLTRDTVEELGTLLREKRKLKLAEMKGIVLDLRNNPGGFLPAMIGVAAAFLPESTKIAAVIGRTPESNMQFFSRPDYYAYHGSQDPLRELPAAIKTLPMVVLVNKQTAAGAEMIAASLQDYRRAKVVGDHTLGYGAIQTIRQLDSETAIKITTAKLVRPSGMSFDNKGVMPDVVINIETDAALKYRLGDDAELAEALLLF